MKRYQQLSVWGSLGTLCLVLSPSCDDDSSNNDGGDGGDGGETTGSGGSTGGTDAGGSGGSTGGTVGGAGLGAGPSVPDCEDDEWLDPEDETCVPCVLHTYTCDDFVDESGIGGVGASPGTSWDPDGNVLTLEERSGLPPIVSASIDFEYFNGSTYVNTTSDFEVDGYLLTAAFPELTIEAGYSNAVTVEDACGNESVIGSPGENVNWYMDGDDDVFYCEY